MNQFKNMKKTFPAKTKAFTLAEIMVTIVIIATVVGFAIPNYNKSVERTYERDAKEQLETIHKAIFLYHAGTGKFWPPADGKPIDDINSDLSINIIENGMTYNCDGDENDFTCTATRNATTAFALRVMAYTEKTATGDRFYGILSMDEAFFEDNPCCSSAPCPTIPNCAY